MESRKQAVGSTALKRTPKPRDFIHIQSSLQPGQPAAIKRVLYPVPCTLHIRSSLQPGQPAAMEQEVVVACPSPVPCTLYPVPAAMGQEVVA